LSGYIGLFHRQRHGAKRISLCIDVLSAGAAGGGTGPLVGLIAKFIPDLQPVFDEFAQCLKREAERC
jgi:hypothetical protein